MKIYCFQLKKRSKNVFYGPLLLSRARYRRDVKTSSSSYLFHSYQKGTSPLNWPEDAVGSTAVIFSPYLNEKHRLFADCYYLLGKKTIDHNEMYTFYQSQPGDDFTYSLHCGGMGEW